MKTKLTDKEDQEQYALRGLDSCKYSAKDIEKATKADLRDQVNFLQAYVSDLHFEIKEWKRYRDQVKIESKNNRLLIYIALLSFLISSYFHIK